LSNSEEIEHTDSEVLYNGREWEEKRSEKVEMH